MRKVEYKEKRESIVLSDWDAAQILIVGLLDSDYNVVVKREQKKYGRDYLYLIDFINPEWSGESFVVSGDYEDIELKDGSIIRPYKQAINSINWDVGEKMAKALVDNDYVIMIWTDGETFGGTQPKNYTIHFVSKYDKEHEIRLVE